jgi:hypothetical protein
VTNAVVAACVYALSVWTARGQRVDSALMGVGLATSGLPIGLLNAARQGALVVLAVSVAVGGLVALIRGRWSFALRAVVLVIVAAGLSSWARDVLTRPELGDSVYPYNTWPSAHAATATALFIALRGMLPARLRTAATARCLAVLLAAAAVLSLVTLAHRPSDIACSMLLVGALGHLLLPRRSAGARAPASWQWSPVGERASGVPPWAIGVVAVAMLALYALAPADVIGLLANILWVWFATSVSGVGARE